MGIVEWYKNWKKTKRLAREEADKLEKESEARIAKEERLEEILSQYFSKVVIFPGTITDYERFTGYAVEIIDTNRRVKGILMQKEQDDRDYAPKINLELKEHLMSQGVEAIVGDFSQAGNIRYWYLSFCGLPVKKAE